MINTAITLASLSAVLLKLVKALLIYFVGRYIIGLLINFMKKKLNNTKLDPMLHGFLLGVIKVVLWAEIVLGIMNCFGIDSSSLRTVLAAAGAAIALALQGYLSNFAGGIMLMMNKPFKKGDYISGGGCEGTVDGIGLMYTTLITADNRVVTMPNGTIAASSITNVSAKDTRRLDMEIGISYGTDVDYAVKTLKEFVEKDTRVLPEPAVFCAVKEYADKAVVMVIRLWCKNDDYWGLKFDLQSDMKGALENAGIRIPYPQLDVTIRNKQ